MWWKLGYKKEKRSSERIYFPNFGRAAEECCKRVFCPILRAFPIFSRKICALHSIAQFTLEGKLHTLHTIQYNVSTVSLEHTERTRCRVLTHVSGWICNNTVQLQFLIRYNTVQLHYWIFSTTTLQDLQEHSTNLRGLTLRNIDLEKYWCERDFDGKYVPTNYFNWLQIVINQSRSASEYVKDQSSLGDGILNGRLAIFDFNNTVSSACPDVAHPCLTIPIKTVAYGICERLELPCWWHFKWQGGNIWL